MRSRRDEELRKEIQRVWDANLKGLVYGVRKVYKQLRREDFQVARCTVVRLMTHRACAGPFAAAVSRRRCRPVLPRIVRRTSCSATSEPSVYSRRIVGWRVSNSLRSDLALDALKQALWERDETERQHSFITVTAAQYLSIRYTERLAKAGIEPSVGSRGDSYDNALAESVIGLYKTEVIRQRDPWCRPEDVEFATLEWVWWFNHQRLIEAIGYIPPVEYEEAFYQRHEENHLVASLN